MKIKQLKQTCSAFPSQWEARTEDDKYVYIRYRGGYLSMGVGGTEDEAIRKDVVGIEVGHSFAGEMSTEDMMKHLDLE